MGNFSEFLLQLQLTMTNVLSLKIFFHLTMSFYANNTNCFRIIKYDCHIFNKYMLICITNRECKVSSEDLYHYLTHTQLHIN